MYLFKLKHLQWICAFYCIFPNSIVQAQGLTLIQLFKSAEQVSEDLKIKSSQSERAQEKIIQARSTLLPGLSLNSQIIRQEEISSANSASADPTQIQTKLIATQSLFRGFREHTALNMAEQNLALQKKQQEIVRLALYNQVAQIYFEVLVNEQDLDDLNTLLKLNQQRSGELKKRIEVGRSRKGEILVLQSQIASLQAQIIAEQNHLSESRERLAFISGMQAHTPLIRPTLVKAEIENQIQDLNSILEHIEERPDIELLKIKRKLTQSQVDLSAGAHGPSVDAFADYYFKRPGVLADSKWDVGLSFTLPIYQGGLVQSQKREALLKSNEVLIELDETRRKLRRDISIMHASLKSGLLQMHSYQEAHNISEKNYQEQTHDYRFGLVTNLEVIQALNSLQDTKRILNRTQFANQLAWTLLQTATGKIPE